MSAFVEFDHVCQRIDGRDILRDVHLALARDETLVLLGRSGAGKTTLLKLVNALLTPTSGRVCFDDRDVASWNPIALRRRIGYVIQDGGLFPHYTVARNIGLVPELEGWPDAKIATRVGELLDLMGLAADQATRYPRQLSGGERQRVGIARALAADPPLLLLDEPFAALDPVTRYELQQHFLALRDRFDKAILFVTHDLREALRLGTRIALLHEGRIETIGTPDEFLRSSSPHTRTFLRTLDDEAAP